MARQLDALTFPLRGTRLIEASAGTGKTYTIAALYLRLVLGHGNEKGFSRPLTPPEILVVTFTNAATEELRDRIRSRLTEAADFFRERGDGDEYLQNLRNDFPAEQRIAKARLLDQAAQWMDESAIYTIHAWCQRMLRQHAFDSGSLFDLKLETNEHDILEEAACDYWRCLFYPQPAADLEALMSLVSFKTPQALLEKVRPLLALQFSSSDDPFEMLSRRRQFIEDSRRIWDSDFTTAVDQLRQAQADKTLNGNKYRKTSLPQWFDQLTSWVKHNGSLPDDQVLVKFSRAGLETGAAKNKSAPQHPAYESFDRLNAQLAEIKMDTVLLNHAAENIGWRFRQEKKRRAQMGFDDLLVQLSDALHKPQNQRLADIIRKQFPVAMIDEFQDTDAVQYAAFSKIYLNQPDSGLLMIGDPKQAIYAFRGADIHTYLQARRYTADSHYTLSKNYRSTRGVVQAVNRIFGAAAGYPQGAFLFKDQIPFESVDVQGRTERFVSAGKPVAAVNFWQLKQTRPVSKTGEGGYLDLMAEAAASEMVRLLNLAQQDPSQAGFQTPDGRLKALRPADIAILVRNAQEARAVRQSLNARQVRSVYLSDKESVFDGSEALSMLYLLRACAEPENQRLLKTALATEILNLPLMRLDHLNRNELTWETEVERFRNYQRIWQRQGVLPMLRTLLRDFSVSGRLLSMAGGERVLTNVLHLAELLQTAAAQLDGEHALIRWLAEQLQQPGRGSDEQILRLESDEELIRVVTIHKSKGLEYPLVFLPFICSFREVTRQNSPVVKYHDEEGQLKVVQNPEREDIGMADSERLAEDLRLLYVALTRAHHACWLGIGVMGKTNHKGEVSNLHRSGLGYLMSAGRMILTGEVAEKLRALKGDCEHIRIVPLPQADHAVYLPRCEGEELTPALKFNGQVPRNWRISSYSGILRGAWIPGIERLKTDVSTGPHDFPDSAVEDQLQESAGEPSAIPQTTTCTRSIHHFPRGPQPGTFLHAVLEWAAAEGFAALSRDYQRIEDKIRILCKRRNWDDWIPVLTDWLQRFLKTPLILPQSGGTMRLAELTADNCQSELEFLFAVHQVDTQKIDLAVTAAVMPGVMRPRLREDRINGMFKGFIDLVFCHEGRYYVLDYKSNYLGENEAAYDDETLMEAMLEHRYDLQYVLYILALHRLLKARLTEYDYERDVGGVMYLFLRAVNVQGKGLYTDKPPRVLIEQLDDYVSGQERVHVP